MVYRNTRLYHELEKQDFKVDDFVDEHQFIENVRQQELESLEVFGKAMEANEHDNEMMALLWGESVLKHF